MHTYVKHDLSIIRGDTAWNLVLQVSPSMHSHSLVLCHSCLGNDPNQNSLDA